MKDSDERRERQDTLDGTVRTTSEPPAATDAHAADVAERRARQANDVSGLRRAADALNENQARLRRVSAELRERERELGRTRDLVRDVARSTRALRASTRARADSPGTTEDDSGANA